MRFLLSLACALLAPLASSVAMPVSVTVSAAASLADVMKAASQAYATAHPDVELVFNYGGSGSLQRQIENGAPVDAFLSAAAEPMQALAKAGLVGPVRNVAGNVLVVAIAHVSPSPDDKPLSFLTLPAYSKIAVGDPSSVPAGKYAQQALTKLGLWEALRPKMVFTKDVRQALTYFSQGNVQAAFVYATDFRALHPDEFNTNGLTARTSPLGVVPDNLHDPIVYPTAVLTKAAHPKEAQAFLDFLAGPEGQALFRKFGFAPAPQ